MRKIYQDKYKVVWQDERTGTIKEVPFKEVEGAKAETIQPVGKDEREFFDRYRHLRKMPDGKIINLQEEATKKLEAELEANERNNQDIFY